MSDWGERAHRAAGALDMEAIEAADPEDVQYGFREGAHWQREALLSEEAVERAAKALFYGDIDPDLDVTWATANESVRAEYLAMARVALTAAVGGDDERTI